MKNPKSKALPGPPWAALIVEAMLVQGEDFNPCANRIPLNMLTFHLSPKHYSSLMKHHVPICLQKESPALNAQTVVADCVVCYVISEEWHCHGNYQVWPVWLSYWHCAERRAQATKATGMSKINQGQEQKLDKSLCSEKSIWVYG